MFVRRWGIWGGFGVWGFEVWGFGVWGFGDLGIWGFGETAKIPPPPKNVVSLKETKFGQMRFACTIRAALPHNPFGGDLGFGDLGIWGFGDLARKQKTKKCLNSP